MSTETTHLSSEPLGALSNDIFRYSIGVILPVVIMVFWQWEMAYITPTLVTLMLAPTSQSVNWNIIKRVTLALGLSLIVGIFLTRITTALPLVALVLVGWVLYFIFYRADQGENLLVTVILLMPVLAYPSLAFLDLNLSIETALGVTKAFLLALFSSILVELLFPRRTTQKVSAEPIKKASSHRVALLNTLILLPIVAAFLMFDLQSAMLTLIYVGILVLSNNLLKGVKTCIGVLLANLVGGIIAIVCFELLVMVPIVPFYILLMFLVVVCIAQQVFTNAKGALLASALSCFLLLLTDITNTHGFDMDYAFYERWVYIALANIYVVLCFLFFTAIGWLDLKEVSTSS